MKNIIISVFFIMLVFNAFSQNEEKRIALVIGNAAYQNSGTLKNPVYDTKLMAQTFEKIVTNNVPKYNMNDQSKTRKKFLIKEQRLALLIGNSNYSGTQLKTPANDAVLIGEELKKKGFEVTVFTNSSLNDMKKEIRDFGDKLVKNGGVGLFYFSGYSIQLKGENYLIPIGARIEREMDVELEAINLKRVLGEMEYAQNSLNIVIIDAGRSNPLVSINPSNQKIGLAYESAPTGTFLAFSTTPGNVSTDKEEPNNSYTRALVKALQVPNLKLDEIFKKVRVEVHEKTKGKQIPWENSNLLEDFYFWQE